MHPKQQLNLIGLLPILTLPMGHLAVAVFDSVK